MIKITVTVDTVLCTTFLPCFHKRMATQVGAEFPSVTLVLTAREKQKQKNIELYIYIYIYVCLPTMCVPFHHTCHRPLANVIHRDKVNCGGARGVTGCLSSPPTARSMVQTAVQKSKPPRYNRFPIQVCTKHTQHGGTYVKRPEGREFIVRLLVLF